MGRIQFRFDPEKLVAALTFFASKVSDLDAMKSVKLLYFADKAHLLRYGRPILGDAYYGMEHGPVPTASYNVIRDALAPPETAHSDLLDEYLTIDRSGSRPRFVAKRGPDFDVFSASDIEILEETLQKYGVKSAWELRELAHLEPEIKYADEQLAKVRARSVPIPFHLFFGDNTKMLKVVEAAQEDRDFAEALTW